MFFSSRYSECIQWNKQTSKQNKIVKRRVLCQKKKTPNKNIISAYDQDLTSFSVLIFSYSVPHTLALLSFPWCNNVWMCSWLVCKKRQINTVIQSVWATKIPFTSKEGQMHTLHACASDWSHSSTVIWECAQGEQQNKYLNVFLSLLLYFSVYLLLQQKK